MSSLPRTIQALILFSVALGVFFLYLAQPLLPSAVFYFVLLGWALFVVDGVLTFVRPRWSYYLGLVLAVLALGETLGQPEHYALVEAGNIPATVTLILGSAAQALIITLVGYYLYSERKTNPWAWPSEEPAA